MFFRTLVQVTGSSFEFRGAYFFLQCVHSPLMQPAVQQHTRSKCVAATRLTHTAQPCQLPGLVRASHISQHCMMGCVSVTGHVPLTQTFP